MPSQSPPLTIVVPVYNGERTLCACIESILAVDYPRDQVEAVFVDDGSKDRSREIVAEYPVTLLAQPKRGAAAARNAGIRHARGDYVAFTDADCVVDRQWLSELLKGFDNSAVACVGGEISVPPPENDLERYYVACNPISQENAVEKKVNRFPHVITANAMFRRGVFDEVGLFDERFPSAGGEDVDLGWRIHWAGGRMRYVPTAKVVHRHKSSLRQLFRQHYRYGFAWTVLVGKHPSLFEDEGPTCWGVHPNDFRSLRVSLRDFVRSMRSEGLSLDTRFKLYHLVRQLGEYSGKFAAAVRP